jgi:hypothetical protein
MSVLIGKTFSNSKNIFSHLENEYNEWIQQFNSMILKYYFNIYNDHIDLFIWDHAWEIDSN